MWQEYCKEKEAVEIPEFLIQQTLTKMNRLDKRLTRYLQLRNLAAVSLIILVVFLNLRNLSVSVNEAGGLQFSNDNRQLVGERVTDEVYCAFLNFEEIHEAVEIDNIEAISSPVEGSGRVIITPPQGSGQRLTVEDFESITEVALSQFSFSGFIFTSMTWYLDEDSHAHGTYSFTRGEQRVQIVLDSSGAPFIGNSLLEGREVGLFVADDIYMATFVENGIFYQIVITDVSESDFIEYLQEIIDFLEQSVG